MVYRGSEWLTCLTSHSLKVRELGFEPNSWDFNSMIPCCPWFICLISGRLLLILLLIKNVLHEKPIVALENGHFGDLYRRKTKHKYTTECPSEFIGLACHVWKWRLWSQVQYGLKVLLLKRYMGSPLGSFSSTLSKLKQSVICISASEIIWHFRNWHCSILGKRYKNNLKDHSHYQKFNQHTSTSRYNCLIITTTNTTNMTTVTVVITITTIIIRFSLDKTEVFSSSCECHIYDFPFTKKSYPINTHACSNFKYLKHDFDRIQIK